MLINVGTGYLNAGVEAARYGNAHPTVVPFQVFDTADGTFALAVGNDRMFGDFCEQVIERPDLARDPASSRRTSGHCIATSCCRCLPTSFVSGRASTGWTPA